MEKGELIFRDEHGWGKHYPKYVVRIKALCKKYDRIFELTSRGWELDISFHDIMRDSRGRPDKNPKGAECDAEPHYYQAQMKFHLVSLDDGKRYEELDAYVRHEFLHIFFWKLGKLACQFAQVQADDLDVICADVEEQSVEDLARLDFWDRLK